MTTTTSGSPRGCSQLPSRSPGRLSRAAALHRDAGRGGFTLVELMIVVGILVTLIVLLAVQGASFILSSQKRGTKAFIERLKLHIDEYQAITNKLPPDGLDFRVENAEGVRLRSSAALYHALTAPIEERQMVAGVPKMVRHQPITSFENGSLTAPNPEFPGVRELVDSYNVPIHYDNTLDGLSLQGGEVHYPADELHGPDPRTLPEDQGGVPRPNQPQSQKFDLWSHGSEDGPPIATWNLKERK